MPKLNIHEIPARLLYPPDEAMALLGGISESTFRRMTKGTHGHNRLPVKRIGANVYVQHEVLVAAVAALPDE